MTETLPMYRSGNQAHARVTPGFGARLIRARIRAGFTSQPKLARAAGLAVTTVCRHETEQRPPSLAAITSYARVLNCSAAYLQYGIGDPAIPTAVGHYLRTHRGLNLLVETRARLLTFPWSLITDGDVDEPSVAAIARVIDQNLRERGHSPDSAQRLPSRVDALPDDIRQGHLAYDRTAAAGA